MRSVFPWFQRDFFLVSSRHKLTLPANEKEKIDCVDENDEQYANALQIRHAEYGSLGVGAESHL